MATYDYQQALRDSLRPLDLVAAGIMERGRARANSESQIAYLERQDELLSRRQKEARDQEEKADIANRRRNNQGYLQLLKRERELEREFNEASTVPLSVMNRNARRVAERLTSDKKILDQYFNPSSGEDISQNFARLKINRWFGKDVGDAEIDAAVEDFERLNSQYLGLNLNRANTAKARLAQVQRGINDLSARVDLGEIAGELGALDAADAARTGTGTDTTDAAAAIKSFLQSSAAAPAAASPAPVAARGVIPELGRGAVATAKEIGSGISTALRPIGAALSNAYDALWTGNPTQPMENFYTPEERRRIAPGLGNVGTGMGNLRMAERDILPANPQARSAVSAGLAFPAARAMPAPATAASLANPAAAQSRIDITPDENLEMMEMAARDGIDIRALVEAGKRGDRSALEYVNSLAPKYLDAVRRRRAVNSLAPNP